jgi:hypothetical protein
VGINGSYTFMQDCSTGRILFYSANAAAVINDAIGNLTSGGKIFIKAGTYTFTTLPIYFSDGDLGAIGSTSVNNMEIYGEGNATILKAGTNMNGDVFCIADVKGWYIHDLQIDGNAAHQSASGNEGLGSNLMSGIQFYYATNSTVERVYSHDNKNFGVSAYGGSNMAILNSVLVRNWANGIIVSSSNSIVENDIVNGASDIGISLAGYNGGISNELVEGNSITDINMGVSPTNTNCGYGISVGDGGLVTGATVSENTIIATPAEAIVVGGTGGQDFDITVTGNYIYDSWEAFRAGTVTNLIFSENIINSTTNTGGGAAGAINILGSTVNALVENNQVYDSSSAAPRQGIWWTSTSPGQIIGNTIVVGKGAAIVTDASVSGMQILNNTLNCVTGATAGFFDDGAMSDSLFSGNILLGGATSTYPSSIYIGGSGNTFSNNYILNWWGGLGNGVTDVGTGNSFINNQVKIP